MDFSFAATVFGAIAAVLALESMIAQRYLAKYILRFEKVLIVVQWVLAIGSVAAAVVSVSVLMGGDAKWTGLAMLFTVVLVTFGLVTLLLFALVRDKQVKP